MRDNWRSADRGQPMNYRHAFHAGNFADVFKHCLLLALLESLRRKPAPFAFVDTHAGRGDYDLGGTEANRSGEWREGVARLLGANALPAPLGAYVTLLREHDGSDGGALRRYPGSPRIAASLLRAGDAAILCELEPGEAAALRRLFAGDRRVHVHQRDGYAALGALLPPAQKRGLVLIDPPYEAQLDEFGRIQSALSVALRRWPQAIYAIWYPIKREAELQPFLRWLAASTANSIALELLIHAANSSLRLNGSGMAIINPPWRLAEAAAGWLPRLHRLLSPQGAGGTRVLRLSGETAPSAASATR